MSDFLTRPVFPLDLNLQADDQRWIYDDSAQEIGLNGPATAGAQSFAKQRVKLLAETIDAATREAVETWLASIDTSARSMWFPCDLGELTVLAIENAGARQVRIVGQDWAINLALAPGMVLRFFSPAGVSHRAKITAIAAAGDDEVITLDVLPAGLSANWHVSRLILGRIVDFSWLHQSEGLSDLDITALELPLEYDAPGSANDAVRVEAWLYTITRFTTRSDVVCWRMTSAPVAITHEGDVYAPAQIDHDKIATSTEGDTDQLSLRMGDWAANPFASWFPRHSAGSFGVIADRVPIDMVTAASVGAAVRLFRGEVADVARKGPVYSISCKSQLALSTSRAPGFMVQTFCNYALFDENTCGLSEDDFRLEGEIAALNPAASTLDFECADLADKAEAWLVRGYITITAGDEVETRLIRSATALTPTRHRLTLNMPTTLAEAGADVVALPGCDKSVTMCHARFSNRKRFGGHPFLPSYNPSVAAIKPAAASGGGKK